MLKNKTILIGITAGIAAYKIYELIRMYRKSGADVKVVLTENALNFVNILTLQTLSGNKVNVKQYETDCFSPEHISLADDCDVFVIAPASANTIGKLANGICDNLLTSIACAFKKPLILAPAMNTGMWENKFVQENVKKLTLAGYEILPPETGYLACGANGVGRMCEPEQIFNKTLAIFKKLNEKKILSGKKIVITAGGTRENIDPVRYISNCSSGKMGKALAQMAFELGGDVVLVTTKPENSAPYSQIPVESALEMRQETIKAFDGADCVIMAAAVADYRVKNPSEQKIKKESQAAETLTLELVKNPDILAELAQTKKQGQVVVGFCAETQDLFANAEAKLQRKNCDFLIANDVSRKDIAFESDYNEVYIFSKDLAPKKIEKNTKRNVAKEILEFIFDEKR